MIPDFQSLMLPLLKFASDGEEKSVSDSVDHLAKIYNLTSEDLEQLLPSKTQKVFANRAQWAKSYLKMAGLIENTGRGYFKITTLGKEALKNNPGKINIAYLNKFPGFKEKRNPVVNDHPEVNENEVETDLTPEENIEQSYKSINVQLTQDILQKVKDMSPAFFEKLVVDLLVQMGYGGSIEDAGKAVGKSGDEGIDGVIKEDRLGLDAIYIQAKRYKDISIGRPEIQKFVGALAGQAAKKRRIPNHFIFYKRRFGLC